MVNTHLFFFLFANIARLFAQFSRFFQLNSVIFSGIVSKLVKAQIWRQSAVVCKFMPQSAHPRFHRRRAKVHGRADRFGLRLLHPALTHPHRAAREARGLHLRLGVLDQVADRHRSRHNASVFVLRHGYFPFLAGFFAVLADSRNALAVGAPLVPGLRIFSPDPAAILALFRAMFRYKPGLA